MPVQRGGAVSVQINLAAVRGLLRSPEVLADLRRRAEQVQARCGAGYLVDAYVGRRRARASVRTADARWAAHERAHHKLLAALDAARS